MDGSSIIDTVKIGLEYILLAIFLLLAINVIEVRNDCSNAMNVKKVMENKAKENLEFSEYQRGDDQANKTECLPADDVLACIRNYRDGSVTIYVDDIGGTSYTFDKSVAQNDNSTIRNRYTQRWLTNHMDMKKYYHPYLIYDERDVTDKNAYNVKGDSVTGVAFLVYK